MKKICENPECGREFEPIRKNKRFCSKPCNRKQYRQKNHKQELERQRRYIEKNREKIRKQRHQYNTQNREQQRRRNQSPIGRVFSYKSRAKQRGLEWLLTNEQALSLFGRPCHYCGGEGFGIDRIDSTLGYTYENSVPCCSTCNYMKRTMGIAHFLAHVYRIARHQLISSG